MFGERMNVFHAKGKIAAALAAVMVLVTPSTVFASGEAAGTYQPSEIAKTSIFGVASDFGVFAKESIEFTAHSDTNFASKVVVLDRNINVTNCHLDSTTSYASTWIQKDGNTNRLEDLTTLVVKKYGTGEKAQDGSYKTQDVTKELITNSLQRIAGEKVDIQIEGETPYIDFDSEFVKMKGLSTELSYMYVDIPYTYDRQYYDYTNVKTLEDYYCLNMTVEQYENARDLYIKLPANKRLSINIINPDNKPIKAGNMKVNVYCGVEGRYKQLNGWTRLASKIVLNVTGEGVLFDASNVETGGLLLAPGCDVRIGNHVGSIICNRFLSNNGEVHYVRTSYPGGCPDVCPVD